MSKYNPEIEEGTSSVIKDELKEPSMYKVLLLNDNYTTMEFVVEVLVTVFHKTVEEATQIMMNVHKTGAGVCGVYPYDIAEVKVDTVLKLARDNGFPLQSIMEKE